ncbi:MAG: hypothetical protein IPP29_10500 [Bacteroidetes bacterium]|nr:hypothetical protein [Bacteroidota bacterium]
MKFNQDFFRANSNRLAKKNFLRTDFLFFITGIIILGLTILFLRSPLKINIHDTYLLIAKTDIAVGFFLLFLILALIYFLFIKLNRPLRKTLGITHYLLTTISLVAIATLCIFSSGESMTQPFDFMTFIAISVLVFAVGQLILVLNIAVSLLNKRH